MEVAWVDDSGWAKLTASVNEEGVVAVVGAMVKGESGVGKPHELHSGRLFDKGASLNALNRNKKSSLLAMGSPR